MSEWDLALTVIRSIASAGGRTLIVGGWVRDRLLDKPSKDIDLEVYGLAADQLHAILKTLGPVNTVGSSFTVYKLGPLDIALPRTESKTGRGHRGFSISGNPGLSISDASRRRDFTINAIAWDPLTNEYYDPHNGQRDLHERRLRMVDPLTFGEDSLRVLRAVQLSARLNFEVDADTIDVCRQIPLDDLPAERIWTEFQKLLLQAEQPSLGLTLARTIGVIDRLFPELKALIDCPQEPEWHPEGDVWTHNLLVIDQARKYLHDLPQPKQVALMLGATCHDFGKPSTTAKIDGRIRSLNHEAMGIEPTTLFLDRLQIYKLSGYDVRSQVIGLVAHHLKPGMWHTARDGVGDGAFRRLARKVDLDLLARVATADCLGRTGTFDCSAMEWFRSRAEALGVENAPPDPMLMGRHLVGLGVTPGPQVGKVLEQIYEHQLDGQITSLDEAIAAAQLLLGIHSRQSGKQTDQ
tara:strand:+ start:2314 stop:3708 length:1395 start_codon:yes stop_codon:yes gene_type:complete